MESPCVKICLLDPLSGLCSGCGRSLDEIAGWADFTDEERRRIMAELPERLKKPADEKAEASIVRRD
jgi:predicted Fe-S protein YdhL (DUF1289 family)